MLNRMSRRHMRLSQGTPSGLHSGLVWRSGGEVRKQQWREHRGRAQLRALLLLSLQTARKQPKPLVGFGNREGKSPSWPEAGIRETPEIGHPPMSACPVPVALIPWWHSHLLWLASSATAVSSESFVCLGERLFFNVWFCFICQPKMKHKHSKTALDLEAHWHWMGPYPVHLNCPICQWLLFSHHMKWLQRSNNVI